MATKTNTKKARAARQLLEDGAKRNSSAEVAQPEGDANTISPAAPDAAEPPNKEGDQLDGELANYLPDAAEIAEEVNAIAEDADVGVEFVEPLLKRLEVDPVKHHVPLVRVLESVTTDIRFPDEPDEMSEKDIAAIRQMIEDDFKVDTLSNEERKEYVALLKGAKNDEDKNADKLRQIRDRRLYREDYSSWDSFCLCEFGFSGTTGDNRIARLSAKKLLKERGLGDIKLGVVAAKQLYKLREQPGLLAEALIAAEETAKGENRGRRDDDVKAEVERRLEYVRCPGATESMTFAEFEALKDAGLQHHRIYNVVESVREKQADGLSFEAALDATDEVVESRSKKAKAAKKAELEAVDANIKAEIAGLKGGQSKRATAPAADDLAEILLMRFGHGSRILREKRATFRSRWQVNVFNPNTIPGFSQPRPEIASTQNEVPSMENSQSYYEPIRLIVTQGGRVGRRPGSDQGLGFRGQRKTNANSFEPWSLDPTSNRNLL